MGDQHYASQLRKSFVLRVPNVIITRNHLCSVTITCTLAEKLLIDFLTLPYLDYTVLKTLRGRPKTEIVFVQRRLLN